jgi:HSP20 family molecular chaperone IbpA
MKAIKSGDLWFLSMLADFLRGSLFGSMRKDFRRVGCEVPAVNIYEFEKECLYEMAAPDFRKEDLHIVVENND